MACVGAGLRHHITGVRGTFPFSHTFRPIVSLGRHTLNVRWRGQDMEQYDYLNSEVLKTRILTFGRLVLRVLNYQK